MIVLKILLGTLIIIFLLLFVFIEFIHDYCKKHVDNCEDKQFEPEQ